MLYAQKTPPVFEAGRYLLTFVHKKCYKSDVTISYNRLGIVLSLIPAGGKKPYSEALKALSTVFQYLKNHLKLAGKSVFFNIKQYIIFFMALFIIQMFYGLITVSADNNDVIEREMVVAEYDYHMVLKNLNWDQANFLINDELSIFKSDQIFKVGRYEQNTNYMTGNPVFDCYIVFTGEDVKACESKFRAKYFGELAALGNPDESFTVSTTPLLNFERNLAANRASYVFISILLIGLSVFLLMALYNIRINHYKFLYGIYMTFGADFRKLFSTAFWELLIVALITFIPATAASALTIFFIYKAGGYTIFFSGWVVLKMLVYTVIIVAVAVFFPMRVMAVRWPMKLIIAEDNSNLVTSPIRSFKMIGAKFPRKYEIYSAWRFRKYNIELLFTAIIFSALFICGLYMAEIYTTDLEYPRAQFSVDLTPTNYSYDETMADELYAINGVSEVRVTGSDTTARNIGSHVMIPKEDVRAFANLIVSPSDDAYRISNDFNYMGYDRRQIQNLEKYKYDGDLYSILEGHNTVIVGDSVSNIRRFRFNVGDKILVAKKTGQIRSVDYNVTGKALLRSELDYFQFEYIECTIGAILYDIPSSDAPLIMNIEDFEYLTGASYAPKYLDVFVPEDTHSEEVERIFSELRDWGRLYGNVNIANNHAINEREIEEAKNYHQIFVVVALLILVISPMVWFFSQTLYYLKREPEFNILQGLGAVVKEIKAIYVEGGVMLAVLSFVFCVALSLIGSYAMFYVYNVLTPYFTHEYVRYAFYMPWYAILTSIVVSVACGYLSSYLPFHTYIKHRSTLELGADE